MRNVAVGSLRDEGTLRQAGRLPAPPADGGGQRSPAARIGACERSVRDLTRDGFEFASYELLTVERRRAF